MSVIILNRALIHYEALGRGRPVVFLHSWVGSWRYWLPSMQIASTSYRAYAPDFFGFGDSSWEPDSYSIEMQARLLTGLMDDLGIGKAAIIGHGLGAWVGLRVAAEQPHRVARILAVGCPLDAALVNGRLRTDGPDELWDWLSGKSPGALALLSDAARADPRAASASLGSFDAQAVFSSLQENELPCLLVYGDADPALVVPSLERTLALGGNVHQVNLEGSGHFPMLEAPDRFNRLLRDFLALEPATSPREVFLRDEWRRRVR